MPLEETVSVFRHESCPGGISVGRSLAGTVTKPYNRVFTLTVIITANLNAETLNHEFLQYRPFLTMQLTHLAEMVPFCLGIRLIPMNLLGAWNSPPFALSHLTNQLGWILSSVKERVMAVSPYTAFRRLSMCKVTTC